MDVSNEGSQEKVTFQIVKGAFGIKKINYQVSHHLSQREVSKTKAGLLVLKTGVSGRFLRCYEVSVLC